METELETTVEINQVEATSEFIQFLVSGRFIVSLIAVLFCVALCFAESKLVKLYLKKYREKNDQDTYSNQATFVHVISGVIKGVIIAFTVIFVLSVNGIKIAALITSVSIVSAVLGLALQDAIKDIIQGIHIICDSYFKVGDVIVHEGIKGEVIRVGIRFTKIKDVVTKDIVTIANRNISVVKKLSNQQDIDIRLSYGDDVEHVIEVLNGICEEIIEIKNVTGCVVKGAVEFEDSGVTYRIRIIANPVDFPDINSKVRALIKTRLDENKISIPFNQLDVHQR